MLFANSLFTPGARDYQYWDLTGLKYWQIEVDGTVGSDNDVEWRLCLPHRGPKSLVGVGERRVDALSGPPVLLG